MSRVLTLSPELPTHALTVFLSSDKFMAVSLAILLHVMVLALLLSGWQENKPMEAKINSVTLQILMHTPAKVPVEVPSKPQVKPKPPVIEPPKPIQKEAPKPEIKKAKFAKKRVDKKPMPKVDEVVKKQLKKPVIRDDLPLEPTKPIQTQTASEPAVQAKADSSASVNKKFDASQYFPVKKNPPAYPRRALNRGVQGECTVSYTVNTQGRVESPKALSDCHAFFIKPSLRATKSFRYTPRIVNGKAVNVANVKNTFQYRIE